MNSETSAAVRHNEARRRYELVLDDAVIGFADYRDEGGRRVFPHTEVRSSHEGRGFGARLVQAALDDTRSRGLTVLPLCSFVAAYIHRNPEYADLLAS